MNLHETIGRLLGLDNVRSIENVEPSFGASWAHRTPLLVFCGCLALAVVALLFYARYQPTNRRKTRAALAVLRAVLLGLLLIILAEPVLTVKLTSSPRPLLWVLFDGTDSMAIEDEMPDAERERLALAVGLTRPRPKTRLRPALRPASRLVRTSRPASSAANNTSRPG
jgi:hypothetical protein